MGDRWVTRQGENLSKACTDGKLASPAIRSGWEVGGSQQKTGRKSKPIALENIEKTETYPDTVHAGRRADGLGNHEESLRTRRRGGYRFYSYGDASLLLPKGLDR